MIKSLVFQVKATPSAAVPIRLRKNGSASYTEHSDTESPEKAALNIAFRDQYEEDEQAGDPNFRTAQLRRQQLSGWQLG